ncbi:MBL fold metallo-hydrolase [Rhodothermus marinus]|uniref:Beta-lactamase domain protein n=1 Tax=Rhodothermus marinus (strain ATCC 43812 / DSM 4252 / R-10) TaxID=518766 RepID=D0MKU4_RHOM4|nr:MBL fold metallo-hydrolase [Rhodothermus marinus]ACY49758.1 beta-lactamase domain protein [Rhodothermus marinus DSM 4252]
MQPFRFGDLSVSVFGGWAEIGGNQILLEAEGEALLLDFGRSFNRWNRHFTEFLGPRSTLGLRDLLALELLPRFRGLYRDAADDTLFPSELERRFLDGAPDGAHIQALLLSHAHLDHSGSIAYLRADLPVVASAATAAILKAMQDTSQIGLDAEAAYLSPRLPNDEGVLESVRRGSYLRRPYRLLLGRLESFSLQSPAKSRSLDGHPWTPAATPLSVGCFRVEAFPVDHSVPGALAFYIETPAGPVVYTGDLRRHGRWGDLTERFVQTLEGRDVFLLITEGTRLDSQGPARTEAAVQAALHEAIRRHTGALIAVDFAPRNLERLQACLEVARDLDRQLVITPKDAYLLRALAEADPSWQATLQAARILQEPRARRPSWEAWLWERSDIHPASLEEIARDPGAFLLAFGFYEINRLLDLRLLEQAMGRPRRPGLYIFSNSYWADEEQRLDLAVLMHWLRALDFRPLPEWLENPPSNPANAENPYHTSGHAPADDLVEVARRLRPRHLLPVHTEAPERWRKLLGGTNTRVLV